MSCVNSAGKMQLLKSGRVRLIGLDGKTYEVSWHNQNAFVETIGAAGGDVET